MNSLDAVIAVVLVAYAVSGYLQGFVVNLVSTVGLLLAGLLAIAVVPDLLSGRRPSVTTSLIALGLVVGAAAIGQAAGTWIGSVVRGTLRWRPLRSVDAVGGSLLSMVAVLCAVWALGYSVSGSSIPYLSKAARGSSILERVDAAMPERATSVLSAFNEVLDASLFPRYLDPFASERIVDTEPPDAATLAAPGVQAATGSVVKILGESKCQRGIEGSGFVYSRDRVMTNAHVVAGVSDPYVVLEGRRERARVVVFDPRLDVAVLAVDRLGVEPLTFDESASAGDDAVILGYPQNGPFDARAARVRDRMNLRSPDIYDRGEVVRETFSVRGLVRSGNSGGPLMSTDGAVIGVIFAASVTDDSTGYALTAAQVADDATAGVSATRRVSTGECA